jgi:hypothetical protein
MYKLMVSVNSEDGCAYELIDMLKNLAKRIDYAVEQQQQYVDFAYKDFSSDAECWATMWKSSDAQVESDYRANQGLKIGAKGFEQAEIKRDLQMFDRIISTYLEFKSGKLSLPILFDVLDDFSNDFVKERTEEDFDNMFEDEDD